jgi:hypothetical protein
MRIVFSLFIFIVLFSCNTPTIVNVSINSLHKFDKAVNHKFVFFVQSNNQINSRIAQDVWVRISKQPAIQGYLYTKGNPINAGNKDYYLSKMNLEGIDYIVIMRLVDYPKVEPKMLADSISLNSNFYADYSKYIAPFAFNPSFERENKLGIIETTVYLTSSGKSIWSCESKVVHPIQLENEIKETIPQVIKKMKQAGFVI